jgi:hypothetical protein
MKDLLRTLFSVRQKRRAPPVGPIPAVGSSIIRGQVKMAVTHPISPDMWNWLVLSGWRSIPVKNDRRKCMALPKSALKELISADIQERDATHAHLLGKARQPVTTAR